MSSLANYLSDHGECIANADDRMDSEIVAELVRQRLALLSDDVIDTISCVYGEMFKKQMTRKEYAEKHGVSSSCIGSRIKKAKYIILKPGTKLMKHLSKDDYYRIIIQKYRKIKKDKAVIDRKRQKEIQMRYKREHDEYMRQLMKECDFKIGYAPTWHDPTLHHFYEVLADLRQKGGRK